MAKRPVRGAHHYPLTPQKVSVFNVSEGSILCQLAAISMNVQRTCGDFSTPQARENLETFSPRRLPNDDARTSGMKAFAVKKMSDATGRVIFKYQMPVLEQFTMTLPKGAEIIRMQDQGGMFWLWAMVRTDVPDEERKFHGFKCGGKIPDDLNLKYVGFCAVFVQQELGLYIFEEVANG
jgi:hypothetical protein